MSEMIDLIVISTLGCTCGYLFWKQNRLDKKTSESIPLLKDRETRLEEGERKLREETLKRVNAENAFEAQKAALQAAKASFEDEKSKLTARSKAVAEGEAKLKGDIESFEEKVAAHEKDIHFKTQYIESREKEVEALQESLRKKAEELEAREAALDQGDSKPEEADEEKGIEITLVEDDVQEPEPEVPAEEPVKELSEDAKQRIITIEEELEKLVTKTNETELPPEDPFDDDSVEALKKAAMKICYVKKYYDVMKDEFIMFPSVAKTALDYRLMEEAEKYYFEEEDEYPADLSGGLRAVAFKIVEEEEDEDFDEEYYTALAQDVEL